MSAVPFTLEYELTAEEVLADVEQLRRRLVKMRWFSGIVACSVIGVAIWMAVRGSLFSAALILLNSVYCCLWTFPRLTHRFNLRAMRSCTEWSFPIAVRVETDERGLRVQYGSGTVPFRLWWKRLSGMEELEAGIGLQFDGWKLSAFRIPWKAFRDDQQRQEFLDLLTERLQSSRSTTAAHRQ